jgi:alpha-N-arabinofuranosidase
MQRRTLLKGAAALGASLALSRKPAFASGAESRIEILLDEPVGTISPAVYGHFTEMLGAVVYGGIWVGEDSKIPNTGGLRKSVIEKLRQIKAPMVRWPGGCFADSYDWADGIGAPAKRPERGGFWRGEPNTFGTPEFMRFCRLTGAEPYFAANVRSLSALAFDRWIEYCNAPADKSTLGRKRAEDGSPDPYNVKYWGIGNEAWGCGGNFTPAEYSEEFRKFTTWTPGYGSPLKFIAVGPGSEDLDWTEQFCLATFSGKRAISPKSVYGWSVHHYTWNLSRGKTDDWDAGKGDALQFDLQDWYEVFREGARIEHIMLSNWDVLGQYDPDHNIKLVVDEYGSWYKPGSAVDPSHSLGQQITMRDALLTAQTLDIFNRHAEKMGIGACAQLINCLNSLFLSHEDKFIVTPNFFVFDMYQSHQGATAVRTEFSAPQVTYQRDNHPATFWGLNGSASIKDKTVTLTVVNPHATEQREADLAIRGGSLKSVEITVLKNPDIHAHNTFDHPEVVTAVSDKVPDTFLGSGRTPLRYLFAPASVTKLSITLA